MKLLAEELTTSGHSEPLAYYHLHWTRDGAPLLDELGASIDHVEALSTGGACSEENLHTACWKCNVRKSNAALEKWNQRTKHKAIKGRYGEPKYWDGFASLFVLLAERSPRQLSDAEREWLRALKSSYSQPSSPAA